MSIQLFSLFFTLSAFVISANTVPPLISTLAEGFGVGASNFGFFITLQFVFFSLASFVGGWVKERLRLTNWQLVTAGLILIVAAFFAGSAAGQSLLGAGHGKPAGSIAMGELVAKKMQGYYPGR